MRNIFAIGGDETIFKFDTCRRHTNKQPLNKSSTFVDTLEKSHGYDAIPNINEIKDQSLAKADITRKFILKM